MVKLENGKTHLIIKRDGRKEPYDPNKLLKVTSWACNNDETSTSQLLSELDIKISDEMRIQDLYDELIKTAVNKISAITPIYDDIAKKLYLMKIYKETYSLKRIGSYPHLREFLKKGLDNNVYHESEYLKYKKINDFEYEFIGFLDEEILNTLNDFIEPERDLLFNYKGLRLFFDKYCKKKAGSVLSEDTIELPQITFMTAAIQSFLNELQTGNKENFIKFVKKSYELLSTFKITYSTPNISFNLRKNNQYASCVLITPDDDTESLNYADSAAALYSKSSGGIAFDASYIRASGSTIESNSGRSDGPIPFIKRLEQTVSAFNQSGKRSGAAIVYFPWWHLDVFNLINLKDAGGAEELRARKNKYSLKINKLLLERYQNNDYVTLFDPKEVPLLNSTYGDEFDMAYKKYEKNGKLNSKKVLAKDILYEFIRVRAETGNLYAFFVENVNKQNITNRYISMSNLCCFSGDEKALIKENEELKEIPLKDLVGQTKMVWNGYHWTEGIFNKYSDKDDLLLIKFKKYYDPLNPGHAMEYQNDVSLRATRDHKWKIIVIANSKNKLRHIELLLTTYEIKQLIKLKDCFNIKHIEVLRHLSPTVHGKDEFVYIFDEIIDDGTEGPTYCCDVPDGHMFVVNGIYTHNCEVTVPSRASRRITEEFIIKEDDTHEIILKKKNGEIGLCNLASINSLMWYELNEADKNELVYNLLVSMDNRIDDQFYPVKEGKYSNVTHRPIGIGITDFANLLAVNKIKFTDPEALEFTNRLYDDIYYKIYLNSMILASERGPFKSFKNTLWAKGLTPLHLSLFAKKNPFNLKFDWDKWDKLGKSISQTGVRFSLHSTLPPSATSGKVTNATEACEPVMDLFYIEAGTYNLPTIVKGRNFYKYYQRCWDVDNYTINNLAAIRQAYIDQAQSFNHYYTKVDSAKTILDDIIHAESLGIKTLYYLKTPKTNFELQCSSCSV